MNRLYKRASLLACLLLISLLVLSAASAGAVGYDYDYIYVSATTAGVTEDGLAYEPGDILGSAGVGSGWFTYFDASAKGLSTHNVNAIDVDAPGTSSLTPAVAPPVYMSFSQNRARVPGIAGWVTPHDVVKFQTTVAAPGYSYEVFFDGADVGLTTVSERIDSLTVWTPDEYATTSPSVPADCTAGLLFISTAGNYRVAGPTGAQLVGKANDILVFCATNLGPNTAGFWYKGFDGAAAGIAPRALRNISVHEASFAASATGPWDMTFSFSSPVPFAVGPFQGMPDTVYLYETGEGIEGELRDLNYDFPTLNGTVDGLELGLLEFTCTGVGVSC